MSVRATKKRTLTFVAAIVLIGVFYYSFFRESLFDTQLSDTKSDKTTLTEQDLRLLQSLSVPDRLTVNGALLKPLLVPRVSGTQANKDVQEYIKSHFHKLGWKIEEDRFNDTTPFGVKAFNNIIVSKFSNSPRKLILAAHFDSKYFPNNDFVGATDSAVPCAILLDVASTLNKYLSRSGNPEVGLELVFFDGEEAFEHWNRQDSVYGARHLANKWSNIPAPNNKNISRIEAIELFVLLDLIGAKDSTILNLQYPTTSAFTQLSQIEKRLTQLSLLSKPMTASKSADYFDTQLFPGNIDDDHRPFLEKGVPIVHLIPYPFPQVWHKLTDNADAIDHDTVVDFSLLMRAFVAEYLRLYL
ncbi:hypothetical protein K7432_000722 [Basidiobolus ranarum]|uniref:Peptide hydrolase n=1 Tax=Basidiobolus ranarum TaxID=34480 RepID=A0ABR2WAS6_9FUNG